jgi:AraC family transcriptional regulator
MTTEVEKLENKEVMVPAALVAQTHASSTADSAAISAAVGAAFGKIAAFQAMHGIAAVGPPRVIYTEWSPTGVKFTAAIPIADVPPPNVRDTPDVGIADIPESQALRFIHHGPYRDVRATYDRIEAWLEARGGIKSPADWAHYSPMWEEYMNDPATTPESDLVTRIYLTLR